MVCKTKHHFNESNIINIEMNIFCRNNLKLLQFHWLKDFMHRYPTHQWWDWPRFFLTRHGVVWSFAALFCNQSHSVLHQVLGWWRHVTSSEITCHVTVGERVSISIFRVITLHHSGWTPATFGSQSFVPISVNFKSVILTAVVNFSCIALISVALIAALLWICGVYAKAFCSRSREVCLCWDFKWQLSRPWPLQWWSLIWPMWPQTSKRQETTCHLPSCHFPSNINLHLSVDVKRSVCWWRHLASLWIGDFQSRDKRLAQDFFMFYFFGHAFILALEVLLMVICNWSQRDFKVPVILRVRRLIAQRVVALWLWVSGTTTFQRHLPWVLTRQALLHALLRFWACWKLNETLVLSNDNFHQSHSWWWQGLWKYDVWWYYWSHDHGFVRQGVAVPEAAVTLQQAIPEEEQTVTIKLQGLKRKRVTVTITDDKAEFIWKGLNLKRYRIWKAYKVFSLTSFHQILKLKNVASGKWK